MDVFRKGASHLFFEATADVAKDIDLFFTELDTIGSKKSAKGNYVEGASVKYARWVSTKFVDVSE